MKINWSLVAVAYVSLFALGFADNARGPVFEDLLKHFSLDDARGSLFFATSSVMSFVGSLAAGKLIRRWGRLKTLEVGTIVMILGLIGMRFAPHFSGLIFSAALFGLSLGGLGTTQNSLAATAVANAKSRKQILSGLHAVYGIASLLSPLVVAFLYETGGYWRNTFLVAVALSLFPLGYGLWVARRNVENQGKDGGSRQRVKSLDLSVPPFEHSRQAILLGFVLGGYVLTELMVSSRLALFLVRERSFDATHASLYVTYFFVALLAGRLFFVFQELSESIISILFSSLFFTAISLGLGVYVDPQFFIFSGFTMAPFFPLFVALLSQKFERHFDDVLATAMAIQSVSVVAMHLGVGWLTDVLGIQRALLLGPVSMIVAGFLLFLSEKNFKVQV